VRPIGQTFATLGCLVLAVVNLSFSAVHAQHAPDVVATNGGPPSFDFVSIKPSGPNDENHRWVDIPGRLSIENFTLRQIIQVAYGLKTESQVIGGPKWIGSERFDIVAKADDVDTQKIERMTRAQ
jgi:hypothetical protein